MNKPMNEKEDCITMMTDSGESVDFYVLEAVSYTHLTLPTN